MPIMTETGFQDDEWVGVAPGAPIPEGAKPILSLEDAIERFDALDADDDIAVAIPNDADVTALEPMLDRAAMIVVAFPSFADGRGFSQARRLRTMGYRGRLRAAGKLVADQYAHAIGSGIDEVAVDPTIAARQPEAQWRAMRDSLSLAYQGTGQGRSILEARRRSAEAAPIAAE